MVCDSVRPTQQIVFALVLYLSQLPHTEASFIIPIHTLLRHQCHVSTQHAQQESDHGRILGSTLLASIYML